MALKLINTEKIWLRVADTGVEVALEPGVWVVKRIPNPKGHDARWIKLVTNDETIIGSAEEALLGNYPDTVDIVE